MRQYFMLFTFGALACLLAGACSEEVVDSDGVVSIGGIPTQVGPVWVYAVIDSLSIPATLDTVTVTATREATLSGGTPAVVWSFSGAGFTVTKFVALLPTGIRIQESSRNEFLSEDFVLPMTTGDSWRQLSEREYDSSEVPFLGAVVTRATTFQRSAKVERTWGFAFGSRTGESVTWIADGVGIVHRHIIKYSPTNPGTIISNEVWDLISYQLN
ncbi:MAG: hypothetical protein IH914_01150 [candidate division Zixibacteria bacterium]|nr:hypothetical protein [candidate division Zixibacteria bacterium]